jgi:hypothetical protein
VLDADGEEVPLPLLAPKHVSMVNDGSTSRRHDALAVRLVAQLLRNAARGLVPVQGT